MKAIKISNYQLMITVSGFVFGSAPLLISSSVAAQAGKDAWLSVIVATILGLLFVWVNTYLGGLYPEKTVIDVFSLLLGKWFGKIVSIYFIFIAFLTSVQIVWYVGDFITTTYMPEQSAYPINILFVAALVIAMLYGLEALVRAIEIFIVALLPFFLISMLMLIPNIKGENLLPVFENGIVPVLKGTIPLLSLTTFPIIFLNMVYPVNLVNVKEAKKSLLKGYLLGMFTAFIGVLMCILVLGGTLTANLRYPLFTITQEINIGVVFSRLEAVAVAVWLTTKFISVFFYFYAGTLGLSQIFKLTSHRILIIPLGLIVVVFSDFIYDNVPYQINWDTYVWIPFSFTVGVILPALLLFIAFVKKVFSKKI